MEPARIFCKDCCYCRKSLDSLDCAHLYCYYPDNVNTWQDVMTGKMHVVLYNEEVEEKWNQYYNCSKFKQKRRKKWYYLWLK